MLVVTIAAVESKYSIWLMVSVAGSVLIAAGMAGADPLAAKPAATIVSFAVVFVRRLVVKVAGMMVSDINGVVVGTLI